MRIRRATPDDAETFLALSERINSETPFMLLESGELQVTAEEQARRIERGLSSNSHVYFLCELESRVVGYAFGQKGFGRRQAHCLFIGVGVIQPYTGRGLGYHLMLALEQWAAENAFHRLELWVNPSNFRAIRLYKKLGYGREGMRKHGLRIDGEFVDLICMSKLIGS